MKAAALSLFVALVFAPGPSHAGAKPRYGGEVRLFLPDANLVVDPALLSTPADVAVARLLHEPLLSLDAQGVPAPGLLAQVPEPDATGRLFRLRVPEGLRFHDDSLIGPSDVVASLSRLSEPSISSPFAALLLPVANLTTDEREVKVSLRFAYPDWPLALAHPATAPLPGGHPEGVGAGPFSKPEGAEEGAFQAFSGCATGRPFVDRLRIVRGDQRHGERTLATGQADLALGPMNRPGVEGPALFATYLAVNETRVAHRAQALKAAIESSIDIAALTRYFVRAPAVPLTGLLPPVLASAEHEGRYEPRRAPPGTPELLLVCDESVEEHRTVAERLQVRLHDAGVAVQVKRLSRGAFRRSVALGQYDLALVSFSLLPEPGLALAQLVHFSQGAEAAREELRRIGAGSDRAERRARAQRRAVELRDALLLVPLFAQASKLVVTSQVSAVGFEAAGAPRLGDVWLLEPDKRD